MRRSRLIAAVVIAVALLFVGGPSLLFSPSTEEVAPESDDGPGPEIVSFEDTDSGFWPYLNARQAHEKRSPINVLVRGDADEVVRLLAEHGQGEWNETGEDHFESDELVEAAANETAGLTGNETADESGNGTTDEPNGTAANASSPPADVDEADEPDGGAADAIQPISPTDIPWSRADGATRYAYLDPGPGEEGYWTTETLQLEDGEYYGYRYHIRAYESPTPEDQWIVMQTHSEHFDWFTLRHRVDGVERAQTRLESDLMAIPGVDPQQDVQRVYLDNAGPSDANGWATRVDLTAMALVPIAVGLASSGRTERGQRGTGAGATVRERATGLIDAHLTEADQERLRAATARLDARHLGLAATILAIVLGVRIAGIALDRTVDELTAHVIAGLLYPFIAVGLPVATYAIASGLERRLDAALAASLSLAAAIWLDYALLGVDVLPVDVVLQRMLVVAALGLLAAGAATRATREGRLNGLLVVGAVAWIVVLAGTLLGYL